MIENPIYISSCNIEEIEKNYIYVKAYIIDSCNYNCSYCYNKKPRTNDILDLDKLYNYLDFIHEQTNRNIKLELIGGEPTLHPDLLNFCEKISKCIFIADCTIYSNFSADIQLYIQLLKLQNITFDMSWHSLKNDFFNKKFYENVVFLEKFFTKQHLNKHILYLIMFEPQHYNESVIIYKKIVQRHICETLLIQVGNIEHITNNFRYKYNQQSKKIYNEIVYKNNQYISKTTKVIYDNGIEKVYSDIEMMQLNDKKIIDLKGWKCNAGIDRLYIHSNGTIYPCQEYYESNITDSYTSIYNKNFSLINKYQICKCNICSCEWYIKKWKN